MEILCPSWRGRGLRTHCDKSGKFISMSGADSLLYLPVKIEPNQQYNIIVEASCDSAVSSVFCNFYGGKNYDFPQAQVVCLQSWGECSVQICSGQFPKNRPIILRFFRDKISKGSIFIKKVFIECCNGLIRPDLNKTSHHNNQTTQNIVSVSTEKETKQNVISKNHIKKVDSKDCNYLVVPPKPLQPIVGKDGIKVSVILSAFNRKDFLNRSLMTYVNQNFPKQEFELIVVDDQSSQDIYQLCKDYSKKFNINFQYILVDGNKGAFERKSFTPALSNNVGFKKARGSVLVVTGPETLQGENNIKLSYDMANAGYCVYGTIYRSAENFVNKIINKDLLNISINELLKIPGAMHDSSVLTGWWWYYVVVRKEYVFNINGVDERFMLGITGEDDNFAMRMSHSGIPLIRSDDIVGIHQDHGKEDKTDHHSFRFSKTDFNKLVDVNRKFLEEWKINKDPVANKDIDWGTDRAIIKHEVF